MKLNCDIENSDVNRTISKLKIWIFATAYNLFTPSRFTDNETLLYYAKGIIKISTRLNVSVMYAHRVCKCLHALMQIYCLYTTWMKTSETSWTEHFNYVPGCVSLYSKFKETISNPKKNINLFMQRSPYSVKFSNKQKILPLSNPFRFP